ncbi:alpha/beta hydrolase family protein [Gryllotalpicola protaetiae]|uniref:alpha/beta hydrolase family protein n=1 Tax=Gryllotalpicola protaetiae TaxID=2419771 RepID=UPI0013C4CA91|nr:alpha/beta fold hydrolase [Gryllotalpicola protaetiae]
MTSPSETFFRTDIRGRSIACARHDADSEATVIFSHGFRGEKTGPNRTFVRAARQLAAAGISSLRFDQYGSGDSDGDFLESRFTDWVETIKLLARRELDAGRRVALFGQSMGASATICAADGLPVGAVVAWVPDANIDAFTARPDGFVEEGGQRVGNAFWQEAYAADVAQHLAAISAPTYLVFGTADEYVSTENREALVEVAGSNVSIDTFDGYPHSAWTATQADDIINRSVKFLVRHLATSNADAR